MYGQKNISEENKTRVIASSVAKKKSGKNQGFGFVDNRSQAVVQRNLQIQGDSSHQANKLAQLQPMTENPLPQERIIQNEQPASTIVQLQIDTDQGTNVTLWNTFTRNIWTPMVNAPLIKAIFVGAGLGKESSDDVAHFAYLIGFPGIRGRITRALMHDWPTRHILGKVPEIAVELADQIKELNYPTNINGRLRNMRTLAGILSKYSMVASAVSLGQEMESEEAEYTTTNACLAWSSFLSGTCATIITLYLYRTNAVQRVQPMTGGEQESELKKSVQRLTMVEDRMITILNTVGTAETLLAASIEPGLDSNEGLDAMAITDFIAELTLLVATPFIVSATSREQYNAFRNAVNECVRIQQRPVPQIRNNAQLTAAFQVGESRMEGLSAILDPSQDADIESSPIESTSPTSSNEPMEGQETQAAATLPNQALKLEDV